MAEEKISRKKDFSSINQEGRVVRGKFLVLQYLKGKPEKRRFAVVVSRKFAGAAKRNRIKRRLREIYRREKKIFQTGFDFVVRPRALATNSSFRQLTEEMRSLANKINSEN